jgi:hypothetical protein
MNGNPFINVLGRKRVIFIESISFSFNRRFPSVKEASEATSLQGWNARIVFSPTSPSTTDPEKCRFLALTLDEPNLGAYKDVYQRLNEVRQVRIFHWLYDRLCRTLPQVELNYIPLHRLECLLRRIQSHDASERLHRPYLA